MAGDRLCLLTVHAHPDDEASKGASTVARYAAEGIETVLVCCTGGEEGEVLNPAMDREEIRSNISVVRRQELDAAAAAIGFHHVELLGYRDSGMPGSPSNNHPDCFARADAEEAVSRLVGIFRRYKPDVVITYGDDQEFYPHPDHLRVHDITLAAYSAAGDAAALPDSGPPWAPKKLYYSTFSYQRFQKMSEWFERHGIELPWGESGLQLPDNDHRITTRIDVSEFAHVRTEALRAHATQIDPESPFWFALSPEMELELNGVDEYILADSSVGITTPETDLFAGLRSQVTS